MKGHVAKGEAATFCNEHHDACYKNVTIVTVRQSHKLRIVPAAMH